jgi:geranylgeranyl pyrophosphate synthase
MKSPSAQATAAPAPDATLLAEVESRLERFVEEADYAPNLRDAVAYALLGGGKRLRPLLAMRCAEAVGGRRTDAIEAACAVEMVHAFSLVHDDLPALDNDAMRRGRPTLHVARGEAMAILAGDALLALAVHAACCAPRDPARMVRELAQSTTLMISGQVYDTLGGCPESMPPAAKLRTIHERKTGALIRCACRMGAISGGARDAALEAIDGWGAAIGLMFQAVDDLLDETQSAEHVGKATGKDRDLGKLTYPAVYGLERTREEVETLRADAQRAILPLGEAARPLAELTEYMASRTR